MSRRSSVGSNVLKRCEEGWQAGFSKEGGAAEILDWLCRETQALAIFKGTERAEEDLDPRVVALAMDESSV